jgi:4-hydroxybenzoate polyprenyltransferase
MNLHNSEKLHIDSRTRMNFLVSALRPRQWVKNVFVFAPLLFSRQIFSMEAAGKSITVFILFCAASSALYLLNDVVDRNEDRRHPVKRLRPIASGLVSARSALAWSGILMVAAAVSGALITPLLGLVLFLFVGVNFLYSIWTKKQVILDVFSISSGFVLRVIGGGVAIEVPLSPWLLLCTILLALFLGFSKRRHELILLGDEAGSHRSVLVEYNPRFLDMMIAVVTACTLMSYALYTISHDTAEKFNTTGLLFTLPFVLYGIFRYLYLVYSKDEGGDPTQDLFSDLPTIINLVLYALTAGIVLYRVG